MAAKIRNTIDQIINGLIEPSVEHDVIFCRSKGGRFSLDMMTAEEEKRFREALAKTSVRVVSFPLGSTERFADLFESGNQIVVLKKARKTVFIPFEIFQKHWYKNSYATKNVLVI